MTLDDIVARCSRFSGYELQFELKADCLRIWDPKALGRSQLAVVLAPGGNSLREAYGRLRHWAITLQEQDVMVRALSRKPEPRHGGALEDPFEVVF